jgi:DNA-binding response OmpR family regulator
MQHILVIDDDPAMTRLLKCGLSSEGLSVIAAGSGEAGLRLARDYPADLVVLDMVLPGIDGMEVLRRLRAADAQLPIILLSPNDTPDDHVRGLEAGADDFLTKPITTGVLLAHVRAHLRRQQAEHRSVLTFRDLTLDASRHHVCRGQREITLTSLEFRLLRTFLEHPQQVLSKRSLLDWIWGSDFRGSANVVEVYVKQLRQKLEADGSPRLLHTIRGVGYVLRANQNSADLPAQRSTALRLRHGRLS